MKYKDLYDILDGYCPEDTDKEVHAQTIATIFGLMLKRGDFIMQVLRDEVVQIFPAHGAVNFSRLGVLDLNILNDVEHDVVDHYGHQA